jgi:hypothetical protein
MPGLKKSSQAVWEKAQRDAAIDAPAVYAPKTDLYDPNDPLQVTNFFASAKVVRKPDRPKAETTKIPVDRR